MNTSINNLEGTASLLRELRDRDSETGLLTANRLYRALLGEIARSGRYGNILSCVLVRIPGLSTAKPEARLKLANKLADSMRNTDYAGIWDADEFLLVLPETDEPGARDFAAKIDAELTDLAARVSDDGNIPEIIIRVTTWTSGDDAEAILHRLETKTRA